MTPPAQQPKEHCDHECVCGVLMIGGTEGDRSPCNFSGCEHDTRSRPHPAPAQPEKYNCGICTGRSSCGSFGHVKHCKDFDLDVVKLAERQQEHDATIRAEAVRQAREDECERIYGLFHEVELLHLNGMAYPDLYNEMVVRIKFIHTEPLSKDGRKKKLALLQAGDPK